METGFIMGVLEVMKISSFMDSLKFLKLAKRFSDKASTTVTEMMRRLDDFVRLEKAFAQTELPKGETGEQHQKLYFPSVCDYHQEKGHHTNACHHLQKQLEAALESDMLNQFDKGRAAKRKRESKEGWLLTGKDNQHEGIFDEPLFVEAKVEGYLVRKIYVDGGALVEVMFEHCFKNLSQRIKARLKETQIDLVGFAMEAAKPLGKIDLEEPTDMTGVPRRIIEHNLNINPSIEPEQQKHRVLAPEKSEVCDGDWRMCIDFKNLNSACPKYCYPLLNIDCEVESLMGFKYKNFLDAYKGYHQIQISKEDEENTMFYTKQRTYCYTKIPFGLKNAKATYKRLIDSTFQSQIGRNLEAYVDDMVVKSDDEKMLPADVAETFDNLRRINMKLNLKKCSFGVKECKFLGYMVTFEGIRANPKKTSVLADLHSPRTPKEMQSLAGKLAALNRFLAKSAESSVQRSSKLYPTHQEERKAKPHLRLKVINDQPIKQILNKTEASRKLTKYDVELRSYNITFEPRNAIKAQVLADFIFETSDEESPENYFRSPKQIPERDATEEWVLLWTGHQARRVPGQVLVLIGPSRIEHTYALLLTFDSTNNEVEYEALLAGLRITREMGIHNLAVKVDSKLVSSQINGNYVASSANMMKYLTKAKEYIANFRFY
nr:hypothetical protein [Tanacetum cinerariifolium]